MEVSIWSRKGIFYFFPPVLIDAISSNHPGSHGPIPFILLNSIQQVQKLIPN